MTQRPTLLRRALGSLLFVYRAEFFASAEEKRNAPDTPKCNEGLDYSADESVLPAEKPSDDIKTKKSDTSPVERTDDGEQQGDPIHYHSQASFSDY